MSKNLEWNILDEEFDVWFKEHDKKLKIILSQFERFHQRYNTKEKFNQIVEKIINKYQSSEYVERWYKRNIEPPESLLYFIINYSFKYGRECNAIEAEKYELWDWSNASFIKGWYFGMVYGQGVAAMYKKQDKTPNSGN